MLRLDLCRCLRCGNSSTSLAVVQVRYTGEQSAKANKTKKGEAKAETNVVENKAGTLDTEVIRQTANGTD